MKHGIDREKKLLQSKKEEAEKEFSEKIKQLAEKRKETLLAEPPELQRVKIKLKELSHDKKEIEKEIQIRENNSRTLFAIGMILGALIFLGGVALVIFK